MSRSTVDISRLVQKLQRFPAVARQQIDKEFIGSARALVSSSGTIPGLVQVSPPFSQGVRGLAAKKQGEAAVARDIRRVYATDATVFELLQNTKGARTAKQFWYLKKHKPEVIDHWQKTEYKEAIARMSRGFDGGSAHKIRHLDARGGRISGAPSVLLLQGEEKLLDRYVARIQKHVGMLAAAPVAEATTVLGTLKGVPAWVARHTVNWARVYDVGDGTKRVVTIALLAPYAAADMQRRWNYVVQYRRNAFARQLPYIMRAALKSSQLA